MGNWNTAVTAAGLEMLAAAANGELFFTRGRCGSGTAGEGGLASLQDVVLPAADMEVADISRDGSTAKIRMRLDNSDVEQGFTLRQVGLFASAGADEALFAAAENTDGVYIPSPSECPGFVCEYVIAVGVGGADTVTVSADPAGYVTRGQLTGYYSYKRQLSSSDDLNGITENGMYGASSGSLPANSPFSGAYLLFVEGTPTGTAQKTQRAVSLGADTKEAIRTCESGTWQTWIYPAAGNADGSIIFGNNTGISGRMTNGRRHSIAYIGHDNILHIGSALAEAGMQSLATEIEGLNLRLLNLERINGVAIGSAYSLFGAAAASHGHHNGTLTSADDLDNIKDWGTYYTATASLPANSPFQNAYILFVFGNGGLGTIQIAVRWAADGYMAVRTLGSDGKTWKHVSFS